MTGLIRVDDVAYDLALENVVRLTGLGGLEAQWLVQAVLAPALLAPKALLLNEPGEYYNPSDELGPVPTEDCPYGYLRATGEVVLCAGPDPATGADNSQRRAHQEGGWHEGNPGTVIWHEDDPRSVHILQWRGDTA